MSVPEEIRKVPRPINTIVKAYGVHHDRFLVIEREKSIKNADGKFRPKNGKTVGHIIDGKYVPVNPDMIQNISMKPTDYKTWGCYKLADDIFHDVLTDLEKFYSESDAKRLYVMAILRVCEPGIRDSRLKEAYDLSWLTELYPDVSLSKDIVSKFQKDLGRTCSVMIQFMHDRCIHVNLDDQVIIDGTLKTDDSIVNDLSSWSRKARLKGRKDISVLYAYDRDSGEPICSQCFAGNEIDAKAYIHFLTTNHIENGIVVVDKGFSIDEVYDYFKDKPNLHYLNPRKRDTSLALKYGLYSYDGKLNLKSDGPKSGDGIIYYKKVEAKNEEGRTIWLYSYKDIYRAMMEEETYAQLYPENLGKRETDLSMDEVLQKHRRTFGTIILESDLNFSPEEAYITYDSRWDIEIMMRFYKSACDFDETDVHSDCSVMGSEFVNFLSVLLTYRLKKRFYSSEKLQKEPYIDILDDLHRVKIIRKDGEHWEIGAVLDKTMDLMEEVGLVEKPKPKRKGRPKSAKPKEDKPKRPVGRPRIHPLPDPNAPKRKPGRPKGSKNKKKKKEEPSDPGNPAGT